MTELIDIKPGGNGSKNAEDEGGQRNDEGGKKTGPGSLSFRVHGTQILGIQSSTDISISMSLYSTHVRNLLCRSSHSLILYGIRCGSMQDLALRLHSAWRRQRGCCWSCTRRSFRYQHLRIDDSVTVQQVDKISEVSRNPTVCDGPLE